MHDYLKKTHQITVDGSVEMERLIDQGNKKEFEAVRDKWLKTIEEHTLSMYFTETFVGANKSFSEIPMNRFNIL